MGLDDAIEFRILGRDLLKSICPDDFGRIDCQKAFEFAKDKYKGHVDVICKVVDAQSRERGNALDCYKHLIHLLKRIMNTGGDVARLQNLHQIYSGKLEFPSAHRDLYLRMLELSLVPGVGRKLVEILPSYVEFKKSKQEILAELQRNDCRFWEGANDRMSEFADIITSDVEKYVEPNAMHEFNVASSNMSAALNNLEQKLGDEFLRTFPYYILRARNARFPSQGSLVNDVDCCVTGTDGKWRDASIIYDLDPSVHLWKIESTDSSCPFGLAIFAETEGYHVAVPHDKKRYLVFEGFPANKNFFNQIQTVTMVLSTHNREFISYDTVFSLSEFVYLAGLITAKCAGIPAMFINTEHSGRQESVEKTIGAIAGTVGLKSDVWKYDRHGRFKLLKDPLTGESFIHSSCDELFEHTHFLEKPRLGDGLVEKIRKDPQWSGDCVFDTWYGWNRFIMDTYNSWSPEEKARHPYAESVFKRGKDPQWNLGIGYCKGFEVDVKKECERLGVS